MMHDIFWSFQTEAEGWDANEMLSHQIHVYIWDMDF